jgi:hypothetical protein
MSNVITDIERELTMVQGEIPESGVGSAPHRIAKELSAWQGKTENDPTMQATLNKYWSNIGFDWDNDPDIPWSAAFISYVVGGDFPGEAAHRKYVENIIGSNGPWKAYSIPKNLSKIRLSPGDVLVKPRSGGYGNSHGAVVYRIANNRAELVGGNVGNTAKIEARYSVDPQGRPASGLGDFKIILKRKKKGIGILPIVGIGALIAVLVLR